MSVLSSIGHVFERIFGVAEKVAIAAEPQVALLFPAESALFNAITNAAGNAEAAAVVAGKQNGSGPQKLALVTASIESSIAAYEKAAGYTTPMTQIEIEGAVNAGVAFLNSLRAPGSTSTAAPVTTTAV